MQSCIPLRVAPIIDDYKVTKGKRFKRGLPEREMFVFRDLKDADEFYNYVNVKFDLQNQDVSDDIPFSIDGKQYFFSFYEVEISDKGLNLFPLAFDIAANAALKTDEFEPILFGSGNEVLRQGNWYIAIESYSDDDKDCLRKNSLFKKPVLEYLRAMKMEYMATHNYNEIVFKN